MRILYVTSPSMSNPYTRTICDVMRIVSDKDEVEISLKLFWSNDVFDYDIIHIMFPHELVCERNIMELKAQLDKIKSKGIKIVSTCHNFHSHDTSNKDAFSAYDLVYSNCDLIFHLGSYSLQVFQKKYPFTNNVLIFHHVYDTLYKYIPNKIEARQKLGISHNEKNILCFGVIRSKEERLLLINLARKLKREGIKLWVPSFYRVTKRTNVKAVITYLFYKLRYRNIRMQYGFVDDKLLPYYYAASDVVFVPRIRILNSGNVPMALYMGRTVVGPNVGNVGVLLRETGNPCFNVQDSNTIIDCLKMAFELENKGKGLKNYKYVMKYCTTENVCKKMLYSYGQLKNEN